MVAKRCINPEFVQEEGIDLRFALLWLTYQVAFQAGDQTLALSMLRELMNYGGLKQLPLDQVYPRILKSANAGNPNGQVFLGFMYEQGVGVAKDRDLAIDYYQNAAAQGDPTALMRLRELRIRLLDKN
jgi:TPR repeat protein